jgi:2-dehydropantoate 2-reductase
MDAVMPAPRSYAVLGTGALGGYYGARLHHGGLDVHFLLHRDYEHVRAHGLRVESKDGDFSIVRPQAYGRACDLPPCDVAMVCLKTTQNRLLGELLPHAVKPGGWVLMMQNGLGIEDAAAAVVPGRPILGGLAFLCSNKIGPGHVRHLDYGAVRLGEYRADGAATGATERLHAVAADLARAGIDVGIEDDLVLARWRKLVWNVTYNGLCVVHRCTTDVLMRDPGMRARCEAVMREVLAAAAACGREIEPDFVPFMMAATDAMASYKPSMLLDYERKEPLEVEAIYGNPLRAARAAGARCPLVTELYERLTALDRANRT